MSEQRTGRLRKRLLQVAGILTGAGVLMLMPLYFEDAFFNINRSKVHILLAVTPWTLGALVLALLLSGQAAARIRNTRRELGMLGALLVCCVLACAMAGFEPAVLTGSEGRQGGLWVMGASILTGMGLLLVPECAGICCGTAVVSGVLVASLGILNGMGLDPLGFYREIQSGQEVVFLSTIGNYDIYGAYLLTVLGVAAGFSLRGKHRSQRILGSLAAVVICLGACASRTDSVVLGLQILFAAGLSLSRTPEEGRRILGLWSFSWICFPLTWWMQMTFSPYPVRFSGIFGLLAESPAGVAGALLLSGLAVYAGSRKTWPDGRRRALVLGVGSLCLILAIAAVMGLAAFLPDEARLDAFRFDDSFGSRRGFIWIRVLQAYRDFPPANKLAGQGLELTRRLTNAYTENTAGRLGGRVVYNDAHCHFLQMLLTTGVLGLAAYVGVYVMSIRVLLSGKKENPACICALLAMAGYLIVMAINVMQPVLTTTYFALLGCGCAAARGLPGESGGKDEHEARLL